MRAQNSPELSHILDYRYRDNDLKSAILKGKDATLVSNIKGAAEKQGVSLCLGVLECEISGDSELYDSGETEYSIRCLYDLEGDLAEKGYSIELNPEFDLIPQDPEFQGQEPDNKEFEHHGDVSSPLSAWHFRANYYIGRYCDYILQVTASPPIFHDLRDLFVQGTAAQH